MRTSFDVIRPSPEVRACVIVFFALWCGGVIGVGVVAAMRTNVLVFVAVPMLVIGLMFGYRLQHVSVVSTGDELVINNVFSTRRVAADSVQEIRAGGAISDPSSAGNINLVLDDGRVLPVDAAGRRLPLNGRGQQRVDQHVRRLRSWLDNS